MPKTPIFLIRGLLREERHWGNFVEIIASRFPDHPIISLSLAGVGKRNHIDSPATISGMTDDLRTQLYEQYPDTEKVILFGLSMGGMITIDWCSRFPEEVEKAVLMNTSIGTFSMPWERLRWQSYRHMLKLLFSDARGQETITLKLLSNLPLQQTIINDWTQLRIDHPYSVKTLINQLLASSRFTANHKPSVPLLVLASEQDKMVSPQCSYKLAEKWNLPIEKHPTAGHDISIDDADWVCEKVRCFL